jgi:hypothetical protein
MHRCHFGLNLVFSNVGGMFNLILLQCSKCFFFKRTFEQVLVQQPIIELVISHLVQKEEKEFVNAYSTLHQT